jgi:glyoxylase-like metal-dependent hydrolase (beta-lactamase superfamily II)
MIHVEQYGPVLAIRMARGFLGRPLAWTTAYWVDGLLIDTGPRCAAPELLKILSQVPVNQIVVTHGHEDTIGGLEDVHGRFPHAPIYAPYRAINTIQEPTRLRLQLYRRLVWGVPKALKQVRALDDIDNTLRTSTYTFRVIETPGHSRDHISLFESTQRWLFSGDAFVGGLERSWTRESDLFSVIGSLQTLVSLRPERLFPSSGEVRRTPRPELAEKIASLQRLCKEVARLDAAKMSVEEMVTCIFKGESSLRLWTGGHLSAANLVEACRSYNALMVATHEDVVVTPPSRARQPVVPDSPDSSANESADRGDMVR